MKEITFEISLKPFKKTTDEYITSVVRSAYEQWRPLSTCAEGISIMLWSADGSELLDYAGKDEDAFEWAYFLGGANSLEGNQSARDPDGRGLHSRNYLYMDNPPVMTYGILRRIVRAFKCEGETILGKSIKVGTTFDPGPEFAISDFKYRRHREICRGNTMGRATMVCAYETLKGDAHRYAAYPDGIPDGEPFGTFLGKQATCFMRDMDMDYIWLSNGLGFGVEPWSTVGAVFDGERFHAEGFASTREKVMQFWTTFCSEFSYPIRVRGSNLSMGIDLAKEGVPLKSIYERVPSLLPPPNSPWAALNGDYGIELAGYMSRIASVPGDEYLYRYYIHDPWWMNSPWYDRYNSCFHDIYLPFAVSRIDGEGKVKCPTHLSLLSIDNSFGNMPDACVYEPLPHLMKAIKEGPDAPSPVVWVYPFDEYSDCQSAEEAARIFAGDWFVRGAINNTFPLSTVTSTTDFLKHSDELYAASVLVMPVPYANTELEEKILAYAARGGRVIFYGSASAAGDAFCSYFELERVSPYEGNLPVFVDGVPMGTLRHQSKLSGGPLDCVSRAAYATAGEYAIAVQKGQSIWLRGTVCADYTGDRLLTPYREEGLFIGETLAASALGRLGFVIEGVRIENEKPPVMMIHEHNGALVFSSFLPSTTVEMRMRTPYGAPILDGYDAKLSRRMACYHFPKAERRECRVFVEQEEGIVSCREIPPVSIDFRRRIGITGLKNATVRFSAESYCRENVTAVLNSHPDFYFVGDDLDVSYVTIDGKVFLEARNVTGTLVCSMPFPTPMDSFRRTK